MTLEKTGPDYTSPDPMLSMKDLKNLVRERGFGERVQEPLLGGPAVPLSIDQLNMMVAYGVVNQRPLIGRTPGVNERNTPGEVAERAWSISHRMV